MGSLVGRPNAGKSTLLNRIVGTKVAIVSDKPQTTRNRILAVVNRPGGQIVLFDTPGIHKPMHRMNERMVDSAVKSLGQVDLADVAEQVEVLLGGEDRVHDVLGHLETGGLGHVGVQLAAAMGAEVTVLSQTLSKEADGRKFGASAYYATADGSAFKELRGRFDMIVNTVSANLPLDAYIATLKPRGALVSVGLPTEPDTFHAGSLIGRDKILSGSNVGGLPLHQEMLDFCAAHGITADVERIGIQEIDAAYERLLKSDVKYRFVIDMATL